MEPREGPDVPFDRQVIAGIREQTDLRRNGASLYNQKPCNINWLWWERMVATLEECQALRERVRELEKNG